MFYLNYHKKGNYFLYIVKILLTVFTPARLTETATNLLKLLCVDFKKYNNTLQLNLISTTNLNFTFFVS